MAATDHTVAYGNLFIGRTDAHGAWSGGCIREPVNYDTIEQHLSGEQPVGFYPLTPPGDHCQHGGGWRVPWGCVDIDSKTHYNHASEYTPDGHTVAWHLHDALAAVNIPSHVEETVNGLHVWVFPKSGWCDAATMRKAL